jgi:hypothetical protein
MHCRFDVMLGGEVIPLFITLITDPVSKMIGYSCPLIVPLVVRRRPLPSIPTGVPPTWPADARFSPDSVGVDPSSE